MDGRLALYSGAVFAGVLLAGALVIKPGLGDEGAAGADDASLPTQGSGQSGNSDGFVSRLTSVFRDDDDDEYEDEEHERYEHDDDDDDHEEDDD